MATGTNISLIHIERTNMDQGNDAFKGIVDYLSGRTTGKPPTFTTEQASSILQSILDNKPQPQTPVQPPEAAITEEDKRFLKLAEEAARAHNIDPTIRTILQRLQYYGAPHGGSPVSPGQQYVSPTETRWSLKDVLDSTSFDHHHWSNSIPSNPSFPDFTSNVFDANFRMNQGGATQDGQFQGLLKRVAETASKLDYTEQQKLYRKVEEILGTSSTARISEYELSNKAQRRSIVSTPGTSSAANTPYISPRLPQQHQRHSSYSDRGSPGVYTPPTAPHEPVDHPTTASTSSSNSNGDRTFVCSKCSISFRRSSDLKRHQKTHLEVFPNTCPLCSKGFARKDALKRHMDTMTCKRNREKLLKEGTLSNNRSGSNSSSSSQNDHQEKDVVQNILSQFGYG